MNSSNIFSFNRMIALRWIVRASSLISIFILLLFFIGEDFNPLRVTMGEWALFLFFPFAVVVGMIVAWWREMWGGLITLVGVLGFYVVHALLAHGYLPRGWAFIAFASPGLLFLLYWTLSRFARRA